MPIYAIFPVLLVIENLVYLRTKQEKVAGEPEMGLKIMEGQSMKDPLPK